MTGSHGNCKTPWQISPCTATAQTYLFHWLDHLHKADIHAFAATTAQFVAVNQHDMQELALDQESIPDIEVRQSERQADMQQQHVRRDLCHSVQRVERQWEEGRGQGTGKLDGQVH